ncbi:C2 calcium-dependent domain-containing protein 4A [Suricata suricatta]|uniref:C2 calcium-dependent domain-containing protein 4A n=1 Tax=Suricata suricatta TaxID=37032 RepID=UPI00115607DA|nr:C2 calcium-dependent domain-containing protein 4A [Suricata suricatta]
MWCLEKLRFGPERRNGILPGRAHQVPALTTAACANVLTPDRIPEFCIPPRLASCTALTALRVSWSEAAEIEDSAGHTDWDPRSQAALSLPHLPRALTVYGFCALLESPHTRRKESLFLGGPAAARLVARDAAPASRSAVVRRSRQAAFDQDVCLDGLSEEQVRRLAVRVKAEQRGRGLERGRLLGQGELLLGPLLPP